MTKTETQIDKFKQAAREIETDDNENRFNEKLGKIARHKPESQEAIVASSKKLPTKK